MYQRRVAYLVGLWLQSVRVSVPQVMDNTIIDCKKWNWSWEKVMVQWQI